MRQSELVYLCVGVTLLCAIVWAGAAPAGGHLFKGSFVHDVAHAGSFAALAFAWCRALRRVPILAVTATIVVFGFAHEGYEILSHAHPFETMDAVMDGVGAVTGGALALSARCYMEPALKRIRVWRK